MGKLAPITVKKSLKYPPTTALPILFVPVVSKSMCPAVWVPSDCQRHRMDCHSPQPSSIWLLISRTWSTSINEVILTPIYHHTSFTCGFMLVGIANSASFNDHLPIMIAIVIIFPMGLSLQPITNFLTILQLICRYYYNRRTRISSWEKPLELMTEMEVRSLVSQLLVFCFMQVVTV